MEYLILTLVLFVLMLFYFKIADKCNIIDKPNHRSAHDEITLRGGGVIFWFASLLYFIPHFQENYWFFIGITLVSLVSFWDDIQSLPNRIRLVAQFTAMSLIFCHLDLFILFPWWVIVTIYIVAVGIINAYNFMDGINGITGLYTLAVLGALLYINLYVILFSDSDFIIYPILASVVFLFFNYRKRAKCFAGDAGSISIAFWVIYLILKLIVLTDSLVWLLFLAVYGVDTIATIIHRLILKENIFDAHCKHFYQILSNEYKMDHRITSFLYALVQIVVSVFVIYMYDQMNPFLIFLVVLVPLLLVYLFKFYLVNSYSKK